MSQSTSDTLSTLVCSAFVKSVSFGGTAAISSYSVLEGWSNVGVVLAPGTEAAGCF